MSFDLETFKANLRFGVAKPSRYSVLLASPDAGISPEIGLFAEEVEMPGKGFATRTMGLMGPGINFPYQEIYTNLRMTFICSSDVWEKKWFEGWHRNIINPKSGFFGYYKDYVRDILIQQQDERGNTTYEAKVLEAWPMLIDNQQLAYKKSNEYQTLTVTFCYWKCLETLVLNNSSGDSGVSGNLTPKRNGGSSGPTQPLPQPPPPIAQ